MRTFTGLAATILLFGCAQTTPVQRADSSQSGFDGAVFGGKTSIINDNTAGAAEHRVFQQGATGWVSLASVRATVEQRATAFCDRKGQIMNPLRETASEPPYILGNFPRVEIVFSCTDKPTSAMAATDDPKYVKLANLKKLLDSGTLTREEFEREKAKVLSQP